MAKSYPLIRIRTVEPLRGHKVRIEFENGVVKELDLVPFLRGPIFEPIRNDSKTFRAMKVEDGAITWDGSIANDVK